MRAATSGRSPADHRQIGDIHVTQSGGATWTVQSLYQKTKLLLETHKAQASVAVGSIEQSELVIEIHRAETSVAVG